MATSEDIPSQQHSELIPIPRSLQIALFLIGLFWLIVARLTADHASSGIATHLGFSQYPIAFLGELFFLFLILIGFALFQSIVTRSGGIRSTNALPTRPTARREWQLGATIGWAAILVAVLPMMLVGDLHPTFWLTPHALFLTLLTAVTLALNTLAIEAAFRGFLFRRLIGVFGTTLATILLSGLYALASSFRPNATPGSVFITFLFGVLLSLAYLRTHAIWLGWGLHFAWAAVMGIAFGLPIADLNSYSTLVDTTVSGSTFLTGGAYGPEAAPFTILVLIAAMFVLYQATRDYAWEYTHAPILAAGYAMDVAPPPAHTAMEQAAAARPSLIQIAPTTATLPSTSTEVQQHLRDLQKLRDDGSPQ